jgi:hypothetical protein
MVTPTSHEVTLLSLEIRRTDDGRLEGRARPEGAAGWHSFSGVLEFLKVTEELLISNEPTAPTLDDTKEIGK